MQLKDYADAIKTLTAAGRPRAAGWPTRRSSGSARPRPAGPRPRHSRRTPPEGDADGAVAPSARRPTAPASPGRDPEAKRRRGEILLEIADTQQHLRPEPRGRGAYNQSSTRSCCPSATRRSGSGSIQALHLAGDYNESDTGGQVPATTFPQEPADAHVLFLQAENSYFRFLAAEKNPNAAERAKEVARLSDETVKRFQAVIEKYPEFPQVNLARYSLGLTYYRKGDLEKAQQAFESIPPGRTRRRAGPDALPARRLPSCGRLPSARPRRRPRHRQDGGAAQDRRRAAGGFVAGQPKRPADGRRPAQARPVPAAAGGPLAQPAGEGQGAGRRPGDLRAAARQGVHRPTRRPQAVLERAKVIAQSGDVNRRINELRQFQADPLKSTRRWRRWRWCSWRPTCAAQNKAPEAADLLAKAREQYEGVCAKDPERQPWIASCATTTASPCARPASSPRPGRLRPGGQASAGRPEAGEAALRLGQIARRTRASCKLDAARKLAAAPRSPRTHAAASKLEEEGYKIYATRSPTSKARPRAQEGRGLQEIRGRMLYEAAWGMRELAEPEVEAARKAKADGDAQEARRGREQSSRRRWSRWTRSRCSRSRRRPRRSTSADRRLPRPAAGHRGALRAGRAAGPAQRTRRGPQAARRASTRSRAGADREGPAAASAPARRQGKPQGGAGPVRRGGAPTRRARSSAGPTIRRRGAAEQQAVSARRSSGWSSSATTRRSRTSPA